MKLIVGLGNPGEKYENTRHNLGFMIVEKFLKDFQPVLQTIWNKEAKFKSEIAKIEWQPKVGILKKVILAKPQTYMNNSGIAVKLATSYWRIATSDIWVIHDDIDLPLGTMKIRFGGASAGHKGVESIIAILKTDRFWRFRMGTGVNSSKFNPSASLRARAQSSKLKNVDDFVLGEFSAAERGKLKDLIKRGSKAIQTGLENDLKKAMNRFNS